MPLKSVKKIIIHCSASDFGDAATIDRWHKERGWDRIGYHYVILNGVRVARAGYKPSEDGLLETGRDERTMGAHCYGHNSESLGICIVGNKDFTPAQLRTLGEICRSLMKRYGLTAKDVYGHCEFEPHKTCPNIDMNTIRAALTATEEHPVSTEYKGA